MDIIDLLKDCKKDLHSIIDEAKPAGNAGFLITIEQMKRLKVIAGKCDNQD